MFPPRGNPDHTGVFAGNSLPSAQQRRAGTVSRRRDARTAPRRRFARRAARWAEKRRCGSAEIYANIFASQRLLDDSLIDLSQFITDETAAEFARQEGVAFISGNGTNKPNGLLTYAVGAANAATHPGGALDTVTVASATAITGDELIGFAYGLASPYRNGASFLMSSTTAALLMKLKDTNGNYLLREGLAAGAPATLLGRPIVFDENMPAVAANAITIAFGDFGRGYLVNDRTGVRVLRDPFTNKPYVGFYATKRVGGGLLDPRAIRVIKMAAS
jgi:HK97 family phage major capsid protein